MVSSMLILFSFSIHRIYAEKIAEDFCDGSSCATADFRELWDESARYVQEQKVAGRHPMIREYPWKLRPLPSKGNIQEIIDLFLRAKVLDVYPLNNGLFSNVLTFLDAALVTETTGAALNVSWHCTKDLQHFRYCESDGEDVFHAVFLAIRSAKELPDSADRFTIPNRINPLLLAPSRGLYFSAPFFNTHRQVYSRLIHKYLIPLPRVEKRMATVLSRFKEVREEGGRVIGLHCRMITGPVSNAQSVGTVKPCGSESSIDTIQALLGSNDLLFVASDSETEVHALLDSFGDQVITYLGVARSNDQSMSEVHEREHGASISDAVNAVADVWTLARCDMVMHNSESNMVLTASFINPALQLWYLVDTPDRPAAAPKRRAPPTATAPPQSAILTTTPSKLTHQLDDVISGAASRLISVVTYESPPVESALATPWILVKSKNYAFRRADAKAFLESIRGELVLTTGESDKPLSIIICAKDMNGQLFPRPEDLTEGRISKDIVVLMRTVMLKRALHDDDTHDDDDVHGIHNAVIWALRRSDVKGDFSKPMLEYVGSYGQGALLSSQADSTPPRRAALKQASPPPAAPPPHPPTHGAVSAALPTYERDFFALEADRAVFREQLLPWIRKIKKQILQENAYETRPVRIHGDASLLRSLLPVVSVLTDEHASADGAHAPPKQTFRRLTPPSADASRHHTHSEHQPFIHQVAFYNGGFYNQVEQPPGVYADGTFPARVIGDELARGNAVVLKYTHEWATGAAATADVFREVFRRRVNINTYLSSAGLDMAMDAHNDAHCFVIMQLSGTKVWKIWLNDDKMLPIPEVYTDGRMMSGLRYQYGTIGGKPDVSALGAPDVTLTIKAGDLLYVPRGAIHLTSTNVSPDDAIGAGGANVSREPSMHFTVALPMDHQTLQWGMGVGEGAGVANHGLLLPHLQRAAEQLMVENPALRRSLKPFGSDKDLKQTIRDALHLVVDAMIDETDYIRELGTKFKHWDDIALRNHVLDTFSGS
eukprot:m.968183 g.968183  ORF g.968183 m.968183 type:complete len:1001 (+) comp23915_c0_seq5:235-3237(+)